MSNRPITPKSLFYMCILKLPCPQSDNAAMRFHCRHNSVVTLLQEEEKKQQAHWQEQQVKLMLRGKLGLQRIVRHVLFFALLHFKTQHFRIVTKKIFIKIKNNLTKQTKCILDSSHPCAQSSLLFFLQPSDDLPVFSIAPPCVFSVGWEPVVRK